MNPNHLLPSYLYFMYIKQFLSSFGRKYVRVTDVYITC